MVVAKSPARGQSLQRSKTMRSRRHRKGDNVRRKWGVEKQKSVIGKEECEEFEYGEGNRENSKRIWKRANKRLSPCRESAIGQGRT